METREIYRRKYEAQLREWSAKVDTLNARADALTAQARLDVKPHVDGAHARLDAVRAHLREVAESTDETWDEVKKRADHAWTEATAAVEGALDALKPHTKR